MHNEIPPFEWSDFSLSYANSLCTLGITINGIELPIFLDVYRMIRLESFGFGILSNFARAYFIFH